MKMKLHQLNEHNNIQKPTFEMKLKFEMITSINV